MIYMKIDFRNYKQFATPGRKLIYGSNGSVRGECIGTIEADPHWVDGLKCNGRSVKNILEEEDAVFVLGT